MPLKDEINDVMAIALQRLQDEQDKQTPLIKELQPFKGRPGDNFDSFEFFIYTEFDSTVTHRDSAMITVPALPPQCTDALADHQMLTEYVAHLEKYITFTKFLESSLLDCCSTALTDA
jgi:hypothetical protein